MSLITPFLKKELKDAFLVHTTMESLHKHIPKDILPEDFGGSELPIKVQAGIFNASLQQ